MGRIDYTIPFEASHEANLTPWNNLISAPLTLFEGESCAHLFFCSCRNLFFQPLLNQYITGVPGRAARTKPSLIRAGPGYGRNVYRLKGRQYEQHAHLDVGSGNGGGHGGHGCDNGAGR